MLIEDEEDILTLFGNSLTGEGWNVHGFTNPVIAFEHFKYSPNEFALIISDVRMPGMNGFELTRKVKELNPNVRIILTSAFEINMEEFAKVLPHTQVDGFLPKPVSLKALKMVVKEHMNGKVPNTVNSIAASPAQGK